MIKSCIFYWKIRTTSLARRRSLSKPYPDR